MCQLSSLKPDGLQHFFRLRVAVYSVFRENQDSIDRDVEHATARGHKAYTFHGMALPYRGSERRHDFGRQTGGPRRVVSLDAENDLDVHASSLAG